MDYRQISIQLLEKLGGKENISSNAACMTRLRVGIREASKRWRAFLELWRAIPCRSCSGRGR